MQLTKEKVIEVLKQVYDPEIQVDIWTMGLVYKIDISEEKNMVYILMTLTSPMCPYGPMLLEDVKMNVMNTLDASDVVIDITFDPPWQPNEELRAMLGV